MNHLVRNFYLVFILQLIFGCTHTISEERGAKAPVDNRLIFTNDCPVVKFSTIQSDLEMAPVVTSILAAIAPSLIDKGLSALSAGIRKASGQNDNAITLSAASGSYMYNYSPVSNQFVPNADATCVVYVRGVFSGAGDVWEPKYNGQDPANADFFRKLNIAGPPVFYIESHLKNSNSGIRLKPSFVYYGKRFQDKGKKSPRDVVINYSLLVPGKTENAFAAADISFEDLTPGTALGYKELQHKVTTIMPTLAVSNEKKLIGDQIKAKLDLLQQLKKEINALENPDQKLMSMEEDLRAIKCANSPKKASDCAGEERQFLKQHEVERYTKIKDKTVQLQTALEEITKLRAPLGLNTPFNVKTDITETADIHEWLVFVADVLDDSKERVSTVLEGIVVPESKDAVIAQKKAQISAIAAYKAAIIDVQISESKLKQVESENPPNSEQILISNKELIAKKAAANKAAIDANTALPYPGT